MREEHMEMLADWITGILKSPDDKARRAVTRRGVAALCAGFPVPGLQPPESRQPILAAV